MRPDRRGRPHPDPRADPPTLAFDPASARTEELSYVAADTARIPTVPPDDESETPPQPAEAVRPDTVRPDTARPDTARPDTARRGDGRALAASALLGAVASVVGWLVAARFLPTAAVGEAQLVVSAVLLVGGAAQLGVGVGLQRWLPAAGRGTGRLVRTALLLVVVVSGLAAALYGSAIPRPAVIVGAEGTAPAPWLLLFVLAAAAWGASCLYDALLVGLGRPWWAVWRSGLFGLAQIGAVAVLVVVVGLGADGVLLSFLGPIVAWAVLGSVVIAVLTRSRAARGEDGEDGTLPGRAEAFAFLGPIAVTQFAAALLHHQVPVVMNLRFGPETGAVFFIAWQVVLIVDLVAAFAAHSLAVRVQRAPDRAAKTVSMARLRLLVFALPVLALGAAAATPLLTALGTAYAAADDVLRLLLLGVAFRLVVAHLYGVRRVAGPVPGAEWLQLIGALLVLTVTIVLPVAAGGEAMMLLVSGGYAAVQVACVVAALVLPAGRRPEVEVRSA